ncbi:glycylpeptide N-tetradecanoyltransferase [Pseudohyphozyma bogoriensis]|nr:glycylpeptide N-tetradecanoyltransferase [Pseudohyphozyma bogoriensis]
MAESTLPSSSVDPAQPAPAVPDLSELSVDESSPAPPPNNDGDEGAYGDGDLPEFSEDESSAPTPAPSSSRAPPSSRGKVVPGKKKIPLSNLKKKLGSAAGAITSTKAAAKDKENAPEAGKSSDAMSDEMLDKIMAQFNAEQGGEGGASFQRVDVQKMMEQLGVNKQYLTGKEGLMGKGTKDMASHKFWATQPVTKLNTAPEDLREGPLEPNKQPEEIRQEPYDLHKDFKWVTVDLKNPGELKEVQELLSHNYVEDVQATFRFDYAADFLEWALMPPGYVADWHIGIRVANTGKLVAFISGVPLDLRVRNVTKRFTEINFLCVHKKLRSKRLAPILIKEVTRRTHLRGIFQAIYTAGVFLPTPVTRCQYYHRSLNPKKLVDAGFTSIPRNSTMARMMRHYKVPETTTIPGLREIEKKDLKAVGRLLRAFLARMDLAPLLSNKDVEYALWNGRGKDVNGKRVEQVTWTYVVEDPETKAITDMFSFYTLPSTAVKVKPHTVINAAYLYYYATTATPSTNNLGDGSVATPVTHWQSETPEERKVLKDRLVTLIGDATILAHQAGFDVFNALTLQDNSLFLEDLKFGRGDGFLHYYLYNYSTKPMLGGIDAADGGSGVGVVML